jgi:hypothetical protein
MGAGHETFKRKVIGIAAALTASAALALPAGAAAGPMAYAAYTAAGVPIDATSVCSKLPQGDVYDLLSYPSSGAARLLVGTGSYAGAQLVVGGHSLAGAELCP